MPGKETLSSGIAKIFMRAAARLNQIPVIFSEDFQDGQVLEGVRFANPFTVSFDVDAWL